MACSAARSRTHFGTDPLSVSTVNQLPPRPVLKVSVTARARYCGRGEEVRRSRVPCPLPRDEPPPEASLDGPPPNADHVLQRTLGTVRQERDHAVRRRGRITALTTTF